jgi:hypothetical protein
MLKIGTLQMEVQRLPTLTLCISCNPYTIESVVTPKELREAAEYLLRAAERLTEKETRG